MKDLVKKNILGVDITDASEEDVLEYVFDFLEKRDEKLYIVTPNPEIIMYSLKHPAFRDVLNRAGISLCDGVGLYKAAQFLGKPLRERITGTDFTEELCKASVKNAVTVGFLGGRQGVAERTAECLVEKYPGLKVTYVGEEWPGSGGSTWEVGGKNGKPRATRHAPPPIDILFVAYGFPKQEEWMAENLGKVPVRVMMGVGGAFDYHSGAVARAPHPIRAAGLEWLYRLLRQPWRLRRQLALPEFALLILKEHFRKSS